MQERWKFPAIGHLVRSSDRGFFILEILFYDTHDVSSSFPNQNAPRLAHFIMAANTSSKTVYFVFTIISTSPPLSSKI
jgi:hypothetical protein